MATDRVARWLNTMLVAGIALRFAVLIASVGINPDDHLGVITHIVEHGALPVSNQLAQSYHPPLYYVLMAPLYAMTRTPSIVHFGSFLISVCNLILIRRVIDHPLLPLDAAAKLIGFAFACFGIQIVMFGDFISNDTLTMLIGTAQFFAALRWTERPTRARLIVLALCAATGLLTKGTLLLAPVVLSAYVATLESRRVGFARASRSLAIFCLIWLILGSYKFVENQIHFGRTIVHNLDADHSNVENYVGVWRGWRSVYNLNVVKLIRRPIMRVRDQLSYPLLMYATLWYPHFPDSSFRGNIQGYAWLGSAIYAAAILPTIVLPIGIARAIGSFVRNPIVTLSSALLLSNLAIVIAAGVRYDVWACFQSRLCFQSLAPGIVLFGVGMQTISRAKAARWIVYTTSAATIACSLLYFVIEVALTYGLLQRGPEMLP